MNKLKNIKHCIVLMLVFSATILKAQPPVASFTFTNGCTGQMLDFMDSSTGAPDTWSWTFQGASITTSNMQNVYGNDFMVQGAYEVKLVVSNVYGSDSITQFVNIYEPQSINFNTTDVSCYGGGDGMVSANVTGAQAPYTYSWTPYGGNTSTAMNLTAGMYTVDVVDQNGCLVSDVVAINQPSMLNVALSSETICSGDTGTLTAFPSGGTPPYSYSWNDPLLTTSMAMTDFPTTTTNYTVTVTDGNACYMDNNADLIVNSNPAVNVNDTVICEGGTITLAPYVDGGIAPYSYFWMPGGETVQTLIDTPSDTITYTLSVSDINGCSSEDDATVTVNPKPIANNGFISICEDTLGQAEFDLSQIENSVMGGQSNNVYWYEDAGLTMFISAHSNYQSSSDTVYALVESPQNCSNTSETYLVVKDSSTNAIKGVVNFQGMPITNGSVKLIKKTGNLPQDMELIQIKSVDGQGKYLFNDVPKGTYIVKAFGDTSLYDCIPTYCGDVPNWGGAFEYEIVATCDDTVSKVIDLIVEPVNSGLGVISGQLIEDDGQGTMNKAPGDPIGDIDITVEQSPGGAIMSSTTTDVNGNFTFTGLESGDYIIYADMLGYTTTPQVLSFDGSSMTQTVTLCSNDTFSVVDICNTVITSVAVLPNSADFSVSPNPASDKLIVKFNNDESVVVEVVDVQGKIVATYNNVKDNSRIDVSSLNNGIYHIKFVGDHYFTIKKVLIQR